jgi:hypothetical protein
VPPPPQPQRRSFPLANPPPAPPRRPWRQRRG